MPTNVGSAYRTCSKVVIVVGQSMSSNQSRPTQAKQQRQKELAAPRPPRVEIFIFKFHPGGYFLI